MEAPGACRLGKTSPERPRAYKCLLPEPCREPSNATGKPVISRMPTKAGSQPDWRNIAKSCQARYDPHCREIPRESQNNRMASLQPANESTLAAFSYTLKDRMLYMNDCQNSPRQLVKKYILLDIRSVETYSTRKACRSSSLAQGRPSGRRIPRMRDHGEDGDATRSGI